MRKWMPSLALLIIVPVTILAQTTPSGSYLIKAGKFYDAEKNVFLKNQEIWVEGNKVKAVGTKLTVPKGITVIDLPDATVAPGLIDAHAHILMLQKVTDHIATDALMHSSEYRVLRAAGFAKSYLQSGFTTIRDLGNSGQYLDREVSLAIRRGFVEGPQMLVSGPILSAMDGQFYQLPIKDQDRITQSEYRVIKGAEDAAQAVKEHVNNQVDVIKIVAFGERLGLSTEELKAIVQTAHEHHLPVTAHANWDEVIRKSLDAGVDGIEHAYSIADSTLEKMASKGVYLVATDPSTQSIIEAEEAQGKKEHNMEEIKKMLQPLADRLTRARQKGVMIVAGSDAYFDIKSTRGDAAKQTLIAYWEEGMPVADVLKAATWNAAKALRKNDLGVLKAGSKADIVIFNGDVETDFKKALFNVKMVIKEGKIVHQAP